MCITIVNGNMKQMKVLDINGMENKKELKIFLCLLRKKRVALFIPSTFFFFIFKLLTHIVMLKMINIYPLFIALSMFQMKHFGNCFDECCWNLQR